MNSNKLGWCSFQLYHQQNNVTIDSIETARIMAQHKSSYVVHDGEQMVTAKLSGKLFHELEGIFPVVGDWVKIRKEEDTFIITEILPCKSKFSRKACGSSIKEQVVATNLDVVFVVMGLDQDLNMRRLERFLALIWEGGCEAAIVLNKSDVVTNSQDITQTVRQSNPGIPIFITSTVLSTGTEELSSFIEEGKTVAFVGSSGVGKSSLVNALLKENVQKVKEVRKFKDRGQHTTTNREMFFLPNGGLLIDTPGIRELQLWTSSESLDQSFQDIDQLAQNCYFRNCTHQNEPQCAVQQAAESGDIDNKRLQNYFKLKREVIYFEEKTNNKSKQEKKKKAKVLSKAIRKKMKIKRQNYL